jgi:hypothetical protein
MHAENGVVLIVHAVSRRWHGLFMYYACMLPVTVPCLFQPPLLHLAAEGGTATMLAARCQEIDNGLELTQFSPNLLVRWQRVRVSMHESHVELSNWHLRMIQHSSTATCRGWCVCCSVAARLLFAYEIVSGTEQAAGVQQPETLCVCMHVLSLSMAVKRSCMAVSSADSDIPLHVSLGNKLYKS